MTEENKEMIAEENVQPKPYWFWMKNSSGDASASLTFTTIAFVVTTLVYILSTFESLGPVTIRNFDIAAAGVYFVPLLTLYFGRRLTAAKYDTKL